MKLNVITPCFCPDDCGYYDEDFERAFNNSIYCVKKRVCKHSNICQHAFVLGKKAAKEEIKDIKE